jgi:hypothetical protein
MSSAAVRLYVALQPLLSRVAINEGNIKQSTKHIKGLKRSCLPKNYILVSNWNFQLVDEESCQRREIDKMATLAVP